MTILDLRSIVTLAPARRHGTLAVVLVGVTLTEGVGLLMLVPLLTSVGVSAGNSGAGGFVPSLFRSVGLPLTVSNVLVVFVVITAAQATFLRWQSVVSAQLEQDIVIALRRRLYRAIAGVEWVFFARNRSSDFTHALTEEVDRAGSAAYYAVDLVAAGLIAAVYFAVAFRMSPSVTVLVAIFGAAIGIGMRQRLGIARIAGENLSATSRRLHASLTEHLASTKTALSYGAESRHDAEYEELSESVRAARVHAARQYGRFRQLLSMASAAGLALIVYVSMGMFAIHTAELLVLLFVFARLLPRLTGLYEKLQWLTTQLPAFATIKTLEGQCLEAARPRTARPERMTFARDIRLDGVSLAYTSDAGALAIRDLDLVIPSGSTIVIVGASGSGKSTIADLLMGLLTPSSGRVLVDDQPIRAENVDSWRRQIGYVAQEAFLFHDTVRANLLWARPDADDEDLWQALRMAAADTFVAGLPQGLDTVVGDRGVLVSGGERQRLSLARALLRQPRLLILDEATNALDAVNAARIYDAIKSLHRQMTIVVITHRLVSTRDADRIYLIDNGTAVETGTWHDLMSRSDGRFRKLWDAQGLDDHDVAVNVRLRAVPAR